VLDSNPNLLPSEARAPFAPGDVGVHVSVTEIAREDWQRLLPGEPESWDYYRVVEMAPPPNFRLGAISVWSAGALVAVAPIFRVVYRIDTPLQGALRTVGQWLFDHVPRLVSLPVIGIGSPSSDTCSIGFEPSLGAAERRLAFDAMLTRIQALADEERTALVAVKGLDDIAESLDDTCRVHRFTRVTSVPLAILDLPFTTTEAYLASLPGKTRGYLKRKQRAAAHVRSEYVTSLAGLEDRIFALFQGTLAQSKVDYGDFEQLTPDYFPRVLAALGEGAQCQLWWQGEELLGFQMSLVGERAIVTKHIGMKYPQARELNLYFLAWLGMIDYAIARGIPRVDMGATTYQTKLLFGAHLSKRWLYFRFRGDIANVLLQPLAPFFDFERHDPELKALRAKPVA
jgi:hypothetical protein